MARTNARKSTGAARAAKTQKTKADDRASHDGRHIPVSVATKRAEAAAERAIEALRKERRLMADAVAASAAARNKARATREPHDKALAKKARQKAQRLDAKVAVKRTTARKARADLAKLKAHDLMEARLNNVDVRLRRARAAAAERIDEKLETQTAKFRDALREKLAKAEERRDRARKREAKADRAALRRNYAAAVRAADESIAPKERKPRRRARRRR